MKQSTRKILTGCLKSLGLGALVLICLAAGFLFRGCVTPETGVPESEQTKAAAQKETQLWTCSMHPQIKLPKPGKCPICFMDLIPLEPSSDDTGGLRELSVSPNAARLMQIETVPVERRFVTARVHMVGKVDYDETRVSHITAWVPGRLDRLFVDYTGVPVKKGEHMVSIYSPELLTAQQELLQALKAVKELQNSGETIVRQTTTAMVESAREKLRLLGLTEEQVKRIEKRGIADDHVTIYSPVGGIVVNKHAQEGMYVQTGTRIYTIADLSAVWVNLDAYESDLAWLRYGQHVSFTAEAYPGEAFTGTIAFIHPVLDEATRTVKVRVNVPNKDGRLKPGMFVRAVVAAKMGTNGRVMNASLAGKWICPMHPEIVKDKPGTCDICGMPLVKAENLGYVGKQPRESDKPLVIPATAALLTGKRAVVYVEKPNTDVPTFEGRQIVLGPKAGDEYVVKRGLASGERVVTKGNFKLDAELQIKAKPSMMTPSGGMAGMDHGGGSDTAKKGKGDADMNLPVVFIDQVQDVVTVVTRAVNTSVESLVDVHAAYRAVTETVNAVDGSVLEGYPLQLWKEYSMLLGNDGAVGESVTSSDDASRLADTTRQHLGRMRNAFMLSQKKQTEPAPEISDTFRAQLSVVVDRYVDIQSALAQDNVDAAAKAAGKGVEALADVDMELLSGQSHMHWMTARDELAPLLKKLAAQSDLEEARKDFSLLSEALAPVVREFHPADSKLYWFHCPMAFDNRGANWLQKDDDTRNPYFGSAMLKCGDVREVIK